MESASASSDAPALSVVIPAFREGRRLGPTLDRVAGYLEGQGQPYEILVVDDGSDDDTSDVARERAARGVRLLRLSSNRGKGAAVREGVGASSGRLVLLCDADLATPIEELDRLQRHIAIAPIVFGSRAQPDSNIVQRQPWYRESMGRTFNLLVRAAGGVTGLRDTQCGFKLFDGGIARELFGRATVDGFAFDAEIAFLAHRLGYRVAEVGVEWHHLEQSRVRLVIDSARMLRDVLRFRWRHRRLATAGRLGGLGGGGGSG
ncbi:MAG TPA: glycosyltransferase [Thermoanaerobaculia bacterium]|nr:glycosyltransferase [Thermoanaerobaculia bacterium]